MDEGNCLNGIGQMFDKVEHGDKVERIRRKIRGFEPGGPDIRLDDLPSIAGGESRDFDSLGLPPGLLGRFHEESRPAAHIEKLFSRGEISAGDIEKDPVVAADERRIIPFRRGPEVPEIFIEKKGAFEPVARIPSPRPWEYAILRAEEIR